MRLIHEFQHPEIGSIRIMDATEGDEPFTPIVEVDDPGVYAEIGELHEAGQLLDALGAEIARLMGARAHAPRAVTFFVPGVPQPGGSKKGFVIKTKSGGMRANIVEDAKRNAPWRAVVSLVASERMSGPFSGPVVVSFEFLMPRPASHYGTGKNADRLKPGAPAGHTSKPDVTKLVRSTEDALKGIAWGDDCQVVGQGARKMYANDRRPGCWITVYPFTEPAAEGAKAGASSGAGVGARAAIPPLTPEPVSAPPRGLFDLETT